MEESILGGLKGIGEAIIRDHDLLTGVAFGELQHVGGEIFLDNHAPLQYNLFLRTSLPHCEMAIGYNES